MAKKKKTTKKGAAKPRKSNARGKKASGDMLLVGSKVKAALKSSGCNVASDALDGLNDYVYWLISQATERATKNGRKTVRNHDFLI